MLYALSSLVLALAPAPQHGASNVLTTPGIVAAKCDPNFNKCSHGLNALEAKLEHIRMLKESHGVHAQQSVDAECTGTASLMAGDAFVTSMDIPLVGPQTLKLSVDKMGLDGRGVASLAADGVATFGCDGMKFTKKAGSNAIEYAKDVSQMCAAIPTSIQVHDLKHCADQGTLHAKLATPFNELHVALKKTTTCSLIFQIPPECYSENPPASGCSDVGCVKGDPDDCKTLYPDHTMCSSEPTPTPAPKPVEGIMWIQGKCPGGNPPAGCTCGAPGSENANDVRCDGGLLFTSCDLCNLPVTSPTPAPEPTPTPAPKPTPTPAPKPTPGSPASCSANVCGCSVSATCTGESASKLQQVCDMAKKNGPACEGHTFTSDQCSQLNAQIQNGLPDGCTASIKAGGSCFAKDSTNACLLSTPSAAPEAAYAQCFLDAQPTDASLVPMAKLSAGDVVLTSSATSSYVLANQHKTVDTVNEMLTLHTESGALSLTPDHALFVDGALASAAEAKVGSILSSGVVTRITTSQGAVINPVTASGTILASDSGAPTLAASHPIWIAPLVLESSVARAVINAALLVGGDVDSIAAGVGGVLVKIAATLAAVAFARKAWRSVVKA